MGSHCTKTACRSRSFCEPQTKFFVTLFSASLLRCLENNGDSGAFQGLPKLALTALYSYSDLVLRVMGRPGFEPETSRLKAECSTAELATQADFVTLVNVTQVGCQSQPKLQLS